jgi:tetraacyldisaccharide 4'-kinase
LVQALDQFRYDTAWRSARKIDIPVISIGNLVAGGSGKTVFVDYLIEILKKQHRVGMACRGYRADASGWNDEMKMLKQHHPDIEIEAHPDRYQAARKLQKRSCDVIVLDDAFQHRRLSRDLDIVLLEASDPFSKGLLPYGFRREPISALYRADLIILSHADTLSENSRETLRQHLQNRFGKIVFCGRHQVSPPFHATRGDILPQGKIHLLAGVAKPENVARSLEKIGYPVARITAPGDHRKPSSRQMTELEQSPYPVVVTEKDWVKIPHARNLHLAKVKWEMMDGHLNLMKILENLF